MDDEAKALLRSIHGRLQELVWIATTAFMFTIVLLIF